MILGDFISKYRKESGLTMQDFADKSGLSKAYISILERNHNPRSGKPPIPSLETIRAVAHVIGLDFNTIILALDGDQLVSLDGDPDSPAPSISPEDWELLELFHAAPPEKQAAIRALLK